MAISVRRATADDAAAIAAVHVASWEGAYRGLVPDAWFEERTPEQLTGIWRERLSSADRALVHVAVLERALIGFCGCAVPSRDEDADEDTAEIAAFYIDPAHWRAGAGRALMAAALDELAGRGFATVTLWVFEANPRAQAFYGACGFAPDGARSGEPPELRLRRSLA